MNSLILASSSPRRKALLEQAGLSFSIQIPNIKEEVDPNLSPQEVVMQLAKQKAEAVSEVEPDSIVIGADTVVVHLGHILGKPKDEPEAKRMLASLSANTHEVYTGVALRSDKEQIQTFYGHAVVTFFPLSSQEIDDYIASGESMDKAGAYGIQGSGACFVERVEGDYFSIVGLPIAALYRKLLAIKSL
ncbi:Maf family protein [Salsuginibacillus kocurii]|uniref:Maf family protein n=1 Tax=Salsuginibacillus kocurii TaxID=427078 RepID=UPI00036061AE|nr:Maf family protein [Salsuginibacillus kocurii]